jgi:hypothetical protein
MAHTVVPLFTLDDVLRWLWPADVLKKLKDAYPLVAGSSRDSKQVTVLLPCGTEHVHLGLLMPEAKCLAPDEGLNFDVVPEAPCISNVLLEMSRIHKEFNQVRKCIDWLGQKGGDSEKKPLPNASCGAAKYYFPAITSLLPPTHEMHAVGGNAHFKPPHYNPAPMIPEFKAAGVTLAMAQLCPRKEQPPVYASVVSIQFSDGMSYRVL